MQPPQPPSNGDSITFEDLKKALEAGRVDLLPGVKLRLTETTQLALNGDVLDALGDDGELTVEAVKILLARTRKIAFDQCRTARAVQRSTKKREKI